jgi:hypothetical protein
MGNISATCFFTFTRCKGYGMQQLAFFVANIPNVQKIFNQARWFANNFHLKQITRTLRFTFTAF